MTTKPKKDEPDDVDLTQKSVSDVVSLESETISQNINLSTRSTIIYILVFTVAISFSTLMTNIFETYFKTKNQILSRVIYTLVLFISIVAITVLWKD